MTSRVGKPNANLEEVVHLLKETAHERSLTVWTKIPPVAFFVGRQTGKTLWPKAIARGKAGVPFFSALKKARIVEDVSSFGVGANPCPADLLQTPPAIGEQPLPDLDDDNNRDA